MHVVFCFVLFCFVLSQAHKGLTQMLRKYSFVGMVDVHLSLLQFNTKLILVNHTALRCFFVVVVGHHAGGGGGGGGFGCRWCC